MLDNYVKENLTVLRSINGLNQTQLATYLDISLHSYCMKENNIRSFTLAEAKKISDLFHYSIEQIFFTKIVFDMKSIS